MGKFIYNCHDRVLFTNVVYSAFSVLLAWEEGSLLLVLSRRGT